MIEFSFKGSKEDLVLILGALTERTPPRSGMSTPPILPRHVSEQSVPVEPAPGSEADEARRVRRWVTQGVPAGTPTGLVMPDPPTLEPLHVDPVYGGVGAPGGPDAQNLAASNPVPAAYPPSEPLSGEQGFDFASLPLDQGAWSDFSELIRGWIVNFDAPVDEEGNSTEEQPDRLKLLKAVGSGRWPVFILRWCAHYGSLQGAIYAVFQESTPEVEDLIDFTDRVSANILQVAHAAFPDIVGFHDHSTKWKRELAS